ncbi:MAG: DUF2905 domain-containing protein [Parachlamydiaceae bacterium]|nr:DUF2905 domain-containing protein [Parachlamydiaceae bacterium]
MGKLLLIIGSICLIAGLLISFGIRIPYLGKLPGDISFKGEHFQFYFPIVTCIVLSIILSLIFYLFSKN